MRSATNVVRWLAPLLPRSKMPATVRRARRAGCRRDIELVADADAEVLGELGADQDVVGEQREAGPRRSSRACATMWK